jgi:type IV pilus assembly protein PilC
VQRHAAAAGILVSKVSKQRFKGGRQITEKDITLFTRQLATMMKAGVPLLQTFEIVGRGHDNPAVGKLLLDIKSDVETGSSLSQAFRKYPLQFRPLVLQSGRCRRAGRHSRNTP